MSVKLSDYELGWLVGILEGEGYFEYNGCSQKVTVRMTDVDTISTVSSLVSKIVGKAVEVLSIIPVNAKAQEIFEVRVCGEDARTVMKLIVPYMHQRRRARIWQSLNKHKPEKKRSLSSLGLDLNTLIEARKGQIQ